MYIRFWHQCKLFTSVHGLWCAYVCYSRSQSAHFVRKHLLHSKILCHYFGNSPWNNKKRKTKQPPTAKGEGCPIFSSVCTPRCQALTKHAYMHTRPPPMFRHWNTALYIRPSKAATVLARGFRNFQGNLWKSCNPNQHRKKLKKEGKKVQNEIQAG